MLHNHGSKTESLIIITQVLRVCWSLVKWDLKIEVGSYKAIALSCAVLVKYMELFGVNSLLPLYTLWHWRLVFHQAVKLRIACNI